MANGKKNGNGKKGNGNGSAYKALSEQRRAFVLNYVKFRCHGTRAYKAAYDPDGTKGMTDETAAVGATRLLSDVRIQAALAEKANDPLADLELNVEKILRAMAVTGLAPLSMFAEWDEEGKIKLKASDELPPEMWLPVKKIKTKSTRTPLGNIVLDQEFELSRSNPMLETLADLFKLIPPRKIGVGISRDADSDTDGTPQLPGGHGYPPIPATIAEWEDQVREANITRAMAGEQEEQDDE